MAYILHKLTGNSEITNMCGNTMTFSAKEIAWFGLSPGEGGGYSHTLPIRVCAAQRGRDFEAPDLERGIHFKGVF